jgi:hypothetical protein
LIRRRRGREKKRRANLISPSTRIRKIHECGMILIVGQRRR